MAADLEIETMLVLSTSHLPESIARLLNDRVVGTIVRQPMWWPQFTRTEGWMFYVPSDADDTRYENAAKELKAVIAFAKAAGCSWLMLDRDGPVVDALPHWEW